MDRSASLGMIGGADGPTAVFLTARLSPALLLLGLLSVFAAGVLIALYFKNR